MPTSAAVMAKRRRHPSERRAGCPTRTSGDGAWAAPSQTRGPRPYGRPMKFHRRSRQAEDRGDRSGRGAVAARHRSVARDGRPRHPVRSLYGDRSCRSGSRPSRPASRWPWLRRAAGDRSTTRSTRRRRGPSPALRCRWPLRRSGISASSSASRSPAWCSRTAYAVTLPGDAVSCSLRSVREGLPVPWSRRMPPSAATMAKRRRHPSERMPRGHPRMSGGGARSTPSLQHAKLISRRFALP